MTATMTTVDAILKEVYQGRLTSQLQDEVVGIKRVESTSEGVVDTVGGKYVDFPIRVQRNAGIGYRNELEDLPTAGQQGFAAVHVPLKYGYGLVRMSGQSMKLAEKNYQAFASALDLEMDGLKDDLVKDSARIFYGDGTGVMATITADGASAATVSNIQYMEVGNFIDISDTASPFTVRAASRNVTSITETTYPAGTIGYDGGDIAATNAMSFFRQGSEGREPTGLGLIVHDTATLHTVNPATQSKWKGVVRNNPAGAGTNRALSEGLMIETVDIVRRNGGKTSLILGGLGVRRAYFNLLTQQRRFANTKEFTGGFTGLAFSYGNKEIPMVEDVDCPPNKMFFISESNLKVYRDEDWHWEDTDGTIWKWVHGKDAFEAVMKKYWEMGTNRRNSHAVLNDLTEG